MRLLTLHGGQPPGCLVQLPLSCYRRLQAQMYNARVGAQSSRHGSRQPAFVEHTRNHCLEPGGHRNGQAARNAQDEHQHSGPTPKLLVQEERGAIGRRARLKTQTACKRVKQSNWQGKQAAQQRARMGVRRSHHHSAAGTARHSDTDID